MVVDHSPKGEAVGRRSGTSRGAGEENEMARLCCCVASAQIASFVLILQARSKI